MDKFILLFGIVFMIFSLVLGYYSDSKEITRYDLDCFDKMNNKIIGVSCEGRGCIDDPYGICEYRLGIFFFIMSATIVSMGIILD